MQCAEAIRHCVSPGKYNSGYTAKAAWRAESNREPNTKSQTQKKIKLQRRIKDTQQKKELQY